MSASFLVPRTPEDLRRRRAAIRTWAEYSNGFLGRTGDYMNSSLTALSAAEKWFSQADPMYGENIRKYYEHCRD
ncbi:4-hydroxyphenylacetate 3-hydroxylase N-terminal domain-containing protein [Paenarthrobacter sp. PH39-S1]|uniref:4-hydroxyphenylacetate 3-hydroxylase N-terminal domain-containing protein n=1 Tax=Paenarthrobacter sp. PH39-S1 TaxID=3046204 RepID=UPI0024B886A9|nr:4-hydroxyphenylacetate 3-hydroxylase N-terminal domain-containing protein [Paenarthrobacter sp. PH39-S1]MDJ0358341.1 4-hydroxyphenylacetate 3-hydroxylase N-terminal domain-containing protein [Paenarthrobacter sp. PH39-S1]